MSLFSRLTKILTLECDEASVLMSDSFDRKLRIDERLALHGHLFVCSVCSKLHKQLRVVILASRRRGDGEATQQAVAEIVGRSMNAQDSEPADLRMPDEMKKKMKAELRRATEERDDQSR